MEGTLITEVVPVSSSTTARSVKVPPMSMPTRRVMGGFSWWGFGGRVTYTKGWVSNHDKD